MRVKIKALKWAAAHFGQATVYDTEQWTLACESNAKFRKQLSAKRHEYVCLFLLLPPAAVCILSFIPFESDRVFRRVPGQDVHGPFRGPRRV